MMAGYQAIQTSCNETIARLEADGRKLDLMPNQPKAIASARNTAEFVDALRTKKTAARKRPFLQ